MEVIIDRFEGEFAVVELNENKIVNLPRILVPNAKEGDVIKITIDKKSKENRKENVNKLIKNLFID